MSEKNEGRINWWWLVALMGTVIALWFAFGLYAARQAKPGIYGDMHGAVNALFSGLAFAGVVFAIFMQKKELELQRKELNETQKIQENQRLEFEKQNKTIAIQRFENTFFQLINLHNQIVENLEYGLRRNDSVYGRNAIEQLYNHFKNMVESSSSKNSIDVTNILDINEIYSGFHDTYNNTLGHYFRNLYNIVKFIDNSGLEDKKLYSNILRAQLSDNELCLLFYNCLSVYGREKFKPLVEKYSLLKNMSHKSLFNVEHRQAYRSSAYG